MSNSARVASGHRPFLGWCAFVFPIAVILATPAGWPRWAFMWLMAFAIFAACKLLSWSATPVDGVPISRQLAYLLAWPGLNASRFFTPHVLAESDRPSIAEWAAGALRMIAGVLIFWNARLFVGDRWLIVLGWAGMIGVVLMLHFGSFQLLSCFWRAMGIDARPLMIRPTTSTSLTEFWSNRWNTAFRDFTHQFIFRPLTRRFGLAAALIIGFFFSGVVHDVVISLPVVVMAARPRSL